MLAVFGYTIAMATEDYPEFEFLITVFGLFDLGLLMETMVVWYILKNDEVKTVFKFNELGDSGTSQEKA